MVVPTCRHASWGALCSCCLEQRLLEYTGPSSLGATGGALKDTMCHSVFLPHNATNCECGPDGFWLYKWVSQVVEESSTFNTAQSQTGWTGTLLLLVLSIVNFSPLVLPLVPVNVGKNWILTYEFVRLQLPGAFSEKLVVWPTTTCCWGDW